ncbi:MAG TPA: helix-turn-helix transcriptional regulator [Eudoraea sp.]|nr:helix-turn-helix transcriptional regulator [Eudoraea sp.]
MHDLIEISHLLKPKEQYGMTFLSKFSKILSACEASKNLIIVIYHLEEDAFLYCNDAFKKIVGKNYLNVLEGGWESWYKQIAPEESLLVKTRMTTFLSAPGNGDAITLHYHIANCLHEMVCIKHEIVLNTIEGFTLATNYFFDVSAREKIEQCLAGGQADYSSVAAYNFVTPISPREEQVLKLIADGFSSKQIAAKLYISNHTAISHRKHLIEKFQVRNTAQLIKKASKVIEL